MNLPGRYAVVFILFMVACLDRIDIDVDLASSVGVVIEGHISDEPGPYEIKINTAFDLESKILMKTPVSAERVEILDDHGNSEVLSEVSKGEYQTDPQGIRGTVGNVYILRVEFSGGRVYESRPDTLLPSGQIDRVYFTFNERKTSEGATAYGFDVSFIPSAPPEGNNRFLWKFTGTFQADTYPEFSITEPCGEITCEECATCNFRPLCSGIRNIGFNDLPRAEFIRVAPCSCCTCWFDFFNPAPLLSDDQLVVQGKFSPQQAMYIPLDGWTFQHKVYAKVTQMSLTRQSFEFWKGVKDQKSAINSLFQPVTGKIPANFIQVEGTPSPVQGLFFATGISSDAVFIERTDIPSETMIPTNNIFFDQSCMKLFPYGTTTKPDFWN